MDTSPFFGLDLQPGKPIEPGGAITPEILEQAFLNLWNQSIQPPCGSKKRPHLTAPSDIGKITRCCQCGDLLVYVTKNSGRPVQLEDFPAGTTLEDAAGISIMAKMGAFR